MSCVVENRDNDNIKYLVLSIITSVSLVYQILYYIINKMILASPLIFNVILFIIFVFNWLKYFKYSLEFDNERILIKFFKVNVINVKDIDYYVCSSTKNKKTYNVAMFLNDKKIIIRTSHIEELTAVFDNNNIQKNETINLLAELKQAKLQRIEFIIVLAILLLGLMILSMFNIKGERRIKSKDINTALNVYYLIDSNRFAIFPGYNMKKVIDQRFVKTEQGMYIYLIAQYDNNGFDNECKRIYDPTNEKYIWPKKYEGDAFDYPTIVTKYGKNVFEYACLDETNNIIAYIYFENIKYNEIMFEKKYLPNIFKYYSNEIMMTETEYDYYNN